MNGLAAPGDTLYASVSGQASVVAIPIGADGAAASAPVPMVEGLYVDDFALASDGRLIAAASRTGLLADSIVTVGPDGVVQILEESLAQPSALTIGADGTTVYASILCTFSDPPSPALVRIELPDGRAAEAPER